MATPLLRSDPQVHFGLLQREKKKRKILSMTRPAGLPPPAWSQTKINENINCHNRERERDGTFHLLRPWWTTLDGEWKVCQLFTCSRLPAAAAHMIRPCTEPQQSGKSTYKKERVILRFFVRTLLFAPPRRLHHHGCRHRLHQNFVVMVIGYDVAGGFRYRSFCLILVEIKYDFATIQIV